MDLYPQKLEYAERLEACLLNYVAAAKLDGTVAARATFGRATAKSRNEGKERSMSTVKLVDEATQHPKVKAVFADIKAVKNIDRIPNVWRALATNPDHLELCWTGLKAIMQPGKIDMLTKEIIALAVSADQRLRLLHQLAHGGGQETGPRRRKPGRSACGGRPLQPDEQIGGRVSGRAGYSAGCFVACAAMGQSSGNPASNNPRHNHGLIVLGRQAGGEIVNGTEHGFE